MINFCQPTNNAYSMKTKKKSKNKNKVKDQSLLEFFVAGLVYYDYQKVKLRSGMRVSLFPEPSNPHDVNAIEIFIGRHKLGYVPRIFTEIVLNCPTITRATIKSVHPTNPTHRMVLIQVFAKQETLNRKAICK